MILKVRFDHWSYYFNLLACGRNECDEQLQINHAFCYLKSFVLSVIFSFIRRVNLGEWVVCVLCTSCHYKRTAVNFQEEGHFGFEEGRHRMRTRRQVGLDQGALVLLMTCEMQFISSPPTLESSFVTLIFSTLFVFESARVLCVLF